MAKTDHEVREKLARFIGLNRPTMLGIVTHVDKIENTCTVDDDGVEWLGVRLRAITGENKGMVGYPRTGTHVLCAKVEDSEEWAVVLVAEYESIELTIDSMVINNGENGLVKITEMISWMQKVYTDLQTLKTSLSTFPVAGNGAPLAMVFSPTTPNPKKSDFEDTKIKH